MEFDINIVVSLSVGSNPTPTAKNKPQQVEMEYVEAFLFFISVPNGVSNFLFMLFYQNLNESSGLQVLKEVQVLRPHCFTLSVVEKNFDVL